jgi:hypothetical protein
MFYRSYKNLTPVFFLLFSFITSVTAYCGDIWEITNTAIENSKIKSSYPQVRSYLHLLTYAPITEKLGNLIIADGYIVINKESIRSYNNTSDFFENKAPEYEYNFSKTSEEHKAEPRKDRAPITIALDIIPEHQDFTDPIFLDLGYKEFVLRVQAELKLSLTKFMGAQILLLRPQNLSKIEPASIDRINSRPPEIVISTQFNNEKQDCMVTFCAGNILEKELKDLRQRARFVQSLVTGKHFFSASLGALITKKCQEKLGVRPLNWQQALFKNDNAPKGNAAQVKVSEEISPGAQLEQDQGFFNGIATRNLWLGGIHAKAVVIPFPDMKWVRSKMKETEGKWIKNYVDAISEAVLEFVTNNPALF